MFSKKFFLECYSKSTQQVFFGKVFFWKVLLIFFFCKFIYKITRGGTIHRHRSGGGQARGGSKPKLTPHSSSYQFRYSHMNILVAPLVCAYCNSPMIAFELLAKHEGSPKTRTTSLTAL